MEQETKTKPHRITVPYLLAVGFIFVVTACAWLYLGAVTESRTNERDSSLRAEVGRLWGGIHTQVPPRVVLLGQKPPRAKPKPAANDESKDDGGEAAKAAAAVDRDALTLSLLALSRIPLACREAKYLEMRGTDANAKLDLQHRRKGLLWYSTFGVRFDGTYTIKNPTPCKRKTRIWMPFPASGAVYDEFAMHLDGKKMDLTIGKDPGNENSSESGAMAWIQLGPGAEHKVRVRYTSRGLDRWNYAMGENTSRARDFKLTVDTNFEEVDFPTSSLSPSDKQQTADGWKLTWKFGDLLADSGIAVLMPQKLNPGPLSAEMSRFAPVSLFFFFFVLLLVSVIRQVRLHPVHFGMLAAAFFSFHLLMAYMVDHVPLWLAFSLSSVTSVALVVSYLRLAIGSRFALFWAGGTQLMYLVLFSLAFFLKGYTGLTITIFSIMTLFVVMQLTARIDWSTKFGGAKKVFHGTYPAGPQQYYRQPAVAYAQPAPGYAHPAAYAQDPAAQAPANQPAAPSPDEDASTEQEEREPSPSESVYTKVS